MERQFAYIGTYTNGESKGIYRVSLDPLSGDIFDVVLAGEIENPTYLDLSCNNSLLYSVAKVDGKGGVASFSIDSDTGKLHKLNHVISEGNPPCHVSLDPHTKYLFSANYHMGETKVFPVKEDGSLAHESDVIIHKGSGPNKVRQLKPHAHYAGTTPDGKYLCTVELGSDRLTVFSHYKGNLRVQWEYPLKPGSGPRHLTFHPNGKFAYVNTELSGEIIVFEYFCDSGEFKEIQYISTLPDGFSLENLGSAIHITPDAKYLYAANRGHDTIVGFSIDKQSGKLSFISHTSSEGKNPRDFAIDPTGNFIIAANQDSNSIISLRIDQNTGMLLRNNSKKIIPSPVCVKFTK